MSMFYELMMRKKTQIMYATIKGSLTENDGVFSGFSASNYLKTQQVFSPQDKSWEMIFRFTIDSVSGDKSIVSLAGNNAFSLFQNNATISVFISSNGASWDIVNSIIFSVIANTTYTVKIKFTGNEYIIYSLENNEWVVKKTVSSSAQIYGGLPFVFGVSRTYTNPLSGSIDLNNSYIKIGSTKYNLQAVVGYTVVGSPTITDGVVSGFDSSNYLKITNVNNFKTNISFEFKIVFETSNVSVNRAIISSYDVILQISYNKLEVVARKVGGQQVNCYGITNLINNTKYYAKFRYTLSKLELYLSTDDINYNLEKAVDIELNDASNDTIRFGYETQTIYINECYIKFNNKLWFNGQSAQ